MRVVGETSHTRAECLRRAQELDWMAENAPSPKGAAQAWAEARWWRSLALVAADAGGAAPAPPHDPPLTRPDPAKDRT
jgi:hypothetical protein